MKSMVKGYFEWYSCSYKGPVSIVRAFINIASSVRHIRVCQLPKFDSKILIKSFLLGNRPGQPRRWNRLMGDVQIWCATGHTARRHQKIK